LRKNRKVKFHYLPATIKSVKINGTNATLYSVRKIQNGSYAIGFLDQQIRNVKNGGNIKLDIFFEGSDVPVSITVKVMVS